MVTLHKEERNELMNIIKKGSYAHLKIQNCIQSVKE